MNAARLKLSETSALSSDAGEKYRFPAGVHLLLPGVGELDERGLAPDGAEERQTDGQAAVESGRDGDVRVTGDSRGSGAAAGAVIAVDIIGEAGRTGSQRHDRIQLVLREQRVDAVLARQADAIGAGLEVRVIGQRALGFGLHEQLLREEGHLAAAIRFVVGDQVLERARGTSGRQPGEIAIDAVLEFVEQHLFLGRVNLTVRREVGGIDHFGAGFLQRIDAAREERIQRGIV